MIAVHYGADSTATPRRIERDDAGGVVVEGAQQAKDNPYVGLEAFTEADSGRFFGRKAIVDRLWNAFRDLLSAQNDRPRILPILGPSGSGKSSVARAGLLPELARRPIAEMYEPHVAIMRPRDAPLRELALILARIDPSETHLSLKARDIEKVLRSPDPSNESNWNGLSTAAAAVAGERSLIVLVDQFEETYTLARDDEARRIFLATLLEAASAPGGRVSVIITMRSDFIGSTARDPNFNAVIAGQGVIVPTMTEDELREVIEEPARKAGRPLPRAVVDRLLDESRGRVGALPLLEFALQQIWNGMVEGEDAGEALARIGGVGGALAREAERILEGLGPEEKQIARRAFLAMVSLGEGTQDTRRRASLSEMTAASENLDEVHEVLSAFSREGQRLISLSGGEDGVAAEVTHEALFEQWQTLQNWLDEGREDLRFQRQVYEAAEEWDGAGRPTGMLWRPPLLTRLEDYHARNSADMTERQLEFLNASRNDLRRSRFSKVGTIAAGLIAVFAIGFGVFVYQLWSSAEDQRDMAVLAQNAEEEARNKAEEARIRAEKAQIEAEIAQIEAEKAQIEAQREREAAQTSQSGYLADFARLQVSDGRGDSTTAMLLSLSALPDETRAVDGESLSPRPAHPDAEVTAYTGYFGNRELAVLGLHAGIVRSVAFSVDGSRVVTGSEDGTAIVWDGESGEAVAVLEGHRDKVVSVAISADGRRIVTGSDDGTARLWDGGNGEAVAVLRVRAFSGVAISADGRRVVTGSDDGTAQLWDGENGEAVAVLEGHKTGVRSVAVSTDGHRVATGSYDGTARLWDGENGEMVALLEGHENWVVSVAFSADGRRFLTGSVDRTARLWDSESGEAVAVFRSHQSAVWSVAVSADGSRVVTGSEDGTARVWDGESGEAVAVLGGHESGVRSVAVSADGRRVVTGSVNGTARMWDGESGEAVAVFEGHRSALTSVAVSVNGRRVVTGSEDGTARLWDGEGSEVATGLEGHKSSVFSVAVSVDGRRVVTGSGDGTARLWDGQSGEAVAVLEGHRNKVLSVAVNADGRRVVTGSDDDTATLWNGENGDMIAVLKGHEDGVRSVAVSADGRRVVTGSEDGTAQLWDGENGEPIDVLRGHKDWVFSVAISADGRRVVTGSDDHTARLWDGQNGEAVAVLEGHKDWWSSVAVSADGRRVVTGSNHNTARLWDGENGEAVAVLEGHEEGVRSVAVSTDGRRVVTGSYDGTARLWDGENGEAVAVLEGHKSRLASVAVSADGRRIVTGSLDGTARLWHALVSVQSLVDNAKRMVPRCLTRRQRDRFRLSPEPARWCVTGAGLEEESDPAKWQPKWPYHGEEWRDWLIAKDRGEDPQLPF